jgi:two-component system, chemotaxis family, sensor kinase CheA
MEKKDTDILKKLRAAFQLEAEERLLSMSARLIELEKSPAPEAYLEIVETVFREAHSLKGASRAAGMGEIEKIFQNLESIFAALKRRKIELTPENFDFLHKAVDTVNGFLSLPEEERSGEISTRMFELKKQLARLAGANLPTDQTPSVPAASPLPGKGAPARDYPEIKIEADILPPGVKDPFPSPPVDHPSPEPRSAVDD